MQRPQQDGGALVLHASLSITIALYLRHSMTRICAMQQLAQVNQRFAALLAAPAKDSRLWGTLTLREAGVVNVHQTMQMIPWLIQRAAGSESVTWQWCAMYMMLNTAHALFACGKL